MTNLETVLYQGIEVPKKYLSDAEALYQEAVDASEGVENPFTLPSRKRTWHFRVFEKGMQDSGKLQKNSGERVIEYYASFSEAKRRNVDTTLTLSFYELSLAELESISLKLLDAIQNEFDKAVTYFALHAGFSTRLGIKWFEEEKQAAFKFEFAFNEHKEALFVLMEKVFKEYGKENEVKLKELEEE
ncbi:hypothetical protein RYZ26_17195 [Terasakiella sp. A23]|uniref:hypothetical protein n=1 Tax=Terasakiella sp. FCG-A23 TaxID=3080561 RepID=UPI002955DEF3|nr:hypothetical protein [Terasakiella sp. A23]MDV7341348.1 hypothetical protein [Terasakiella sp. A23]